MSVHEFAVDVPIGRLRVVERAFVQVSSFTQEIVLAGLLIAAVLLDQTVRRLQT